MEQSFGCAFGDGDSRNTSFRLWREECGKEDDDQMINEIINKGCLTPYFY